MRKSSLVLSLLFLLLCLFIYLDSFQHEKNILHQLWLRLNTNSHWHPFLDDRLPQLLVGLLSGASLATSGTVMQSLFKNPLASPSVLGCTFGASLFVCITFATQWHLSFPFLVPLAGILGCISSLFLVYSLATQNKRLEMNILILAGIAVSTVFISLQNVLTYLLREQWQLIQTLTEWSNGQTHDISWMQFHLQAPLTLIGLGITMRYAKELNLLAVGEEEALILGVEVEKVRFRLLLACSLLTGGTIASCGIISFFGLILPHIFRKLEGPNNQLLIPLNIVGGALVFAFLDALLKISYLQMFSIGNLSAVFGGLFFLILLYKQKKAAVVF